MQIAVVTGAAGGMGRAIVDRLLADGLTVAGLDIDAAALVGMTALLGPEFVPLPVDLTDAEACAPRRRFSGQRIKAIVDFGELPLDPIVPAILFRPHKRFVAAQYSRIEYTVA